MDVEQDPKDIGTQAATDPDGAHRRRQDAEDRETIRVRGPQNPSDTARIAEEQAALAREAQEREAAEARVAAEKADAKKRKRAETPVAPEPETPHAVGALTTEDIQPTPKDHA